MKYLLPLLLFLSLTCRAQSVCIPLNIANRLEQDRQKKLAYDSLSKEDADLISNLQEENHVCDSANQWHHKAEAAADSTVKAKDDVIKQKDIVIKNKGKGKVKWWYVPVAAFAAWLVGKAV